MVNWVHLEEGDDYGGADVLVWVGGWVGGLLVFGCGMGERGGGRRKKRK